MALNIKNEEVERLAGDVARITGESKTEAIRTALEERRRRLAFRIADRTIHDLRRFLEREIWSQVPEDLKGKAIPKRERERILGYEKEGV